MAEGILTAIQAALAGLGGGIEGAQQYRAYEQKRKRENDMMERQAAQDARQARLDEATMRNEERQAVGAQGNMVPADVFAKYTMPGATPMQSALTQQIGGKEFAFSPNIMQAEAHRADVMKEKATRAKKAQEQTALGEALASIEIGGKALGDKVGAKLAALDPNSRAIALGARRDLNKPRAGKAELDDDEKRIMGAQFMAANTKNPALMNALNATYARNPMAASDPEMTAYNLMKSKAVPTGITANKGYTAPKPKAESDSANETLEALKAEGAARLTQQGKPAAAKPSAAATPAAQPTLPEGVDPERYKADPGYRAWVDSNR